MKNFQITSVEDGKKYWISRSCAVTGIVYRVVKGSKQVLAVKRGSGTPDFQGYWCLPCGYIDFDETAQEAVAREVLEETGYNIDPKLFIQGDIESDPSANLQNITIRYFTMIKNNHDRELFVTGGEANEVEEAKWINFEDIKNYQWAFNHDKLLTNTIFKDV